jgi:TPP-dependent 2-oxoacid decarboxylase
MRGTTLRGLGGFEADPATLVHSAEALAYADGSAAWATMTGNSSMFFAWLDQGVAAGLLDGRAVTAVSCTVAQMTVQELATPIRTEVPAVVVVVVVDNNGYTVERAIHGPGETCNDISTWDWTLVPVLFGGGRDAAAVPVRTVGELRAALDDATAHPGRFSLVQAVVPCDDMPDLLSALTAALGRAVRSTS